jgi:prepilin-type N-terminal cleavage/methylation domain-containing protein
MSFNNIKTKSQSSRGFTIVELLIVIVVIGILAAITIVAYNGVTARANATSSKLAANSSLKKAEAYNAETTAYPVLPANLTGAATTFSYNLTGVIFNVSATAITTAPATSNVLQFYSCGGTGLQVQYWDYTNAAANKWTAITTGTCTTPTYVTG